MSTVPSREGLEKGLHDVHDVELWFIQGRPISRNLPSVWCSHAVILVKIVNYMDDLSLERIPGPEEDEFLLTQEDVMAALALGLPPEVSTGHQDTEVPEQSSSHMANLPGSGDAVHGKFEWGPSE